MALTQISTQGIKDGTISSADLADQSVTLAKLPHGTSSNDGKFLRANNGADPTFETVNTDLVSDTSPQLGGNLDTNTKNIFFGDSSSSSNNRLQFGVTDKDFQLYHDGSDSYISEAGTGNLIIGTGGSQVHIHNTSNNEPLAKFISNGAVHLYYDNTLMFETINGGARVNGVLHVTSHLDMNDNDIIKLGDSDDLQIFHDGTDSFIDNSTGNLKIISPNNVEAIKVFNDGTVNIGANADNVQLRFGLGSDLKIFHDGTHSFISNDGGAGNLVLYGNGTNSIVGQAVPGENSFIANSNGSVVLYFDNSVKFETKSSGVGVTGNLEVGSGQITCGVHGTTGIQIIDDGTFGTLHSANLTLRTASATRATIDTSGNFNIPNDTGKIRLGTGNDLQIFHNGTDSSINNNTGNLIIGSANNLFLQNTSGEKYIKATANGNVELYHDNNKKFETTSTGAKVSSSTGTLRIASTTDQSSAFLEMTSSSDESQVGKIRYNHANSGIVSGYLEAFLIDGTETNLAVKVDGAIKIPDSGTKDAKLLIGNSDDLKIFHDGSNSQIREEGTGNLMLITNNQIRFEKASPGEAIASFNVDGACELYHDNSKKLETTSSGISVTGSVFSSTGVIGEDAANHFDFVTDNRIAVSINGSEEFRFESDGDFHADGDVIAFSTTISSDEKLKENIKVVPNALNKVQALRGVTFNWKRDSKSSAGVIAQDVMSVLPEAVKEVQGLNDKESYLSVNYNALTSILIEAVKDLSARIKILETK